MNFIKRIFRSNMVDCPRCLGKGHVDLDDIKRLQKELYWTPGQCAYCNGIGKVPPDRIEKVSAGFEYLTVNLPSWERLKVINGDADALKRASKFKELIEKFVDEIVHLYYIENKEPGEIADHFLQKNSKRDYSEDEKQDLVNYIEGVIRSKIK
ncbi:hypothetical protein A4D02_33095 [Niastella koreensis]|uniref:Uncharacterized protein n=2 Tax=Niastella koreensis TaxID=354356 RepID=G8TGJ6_NIAKG|nr:hypothetical protein [Niastella koreensis]AEV97419.1 hypothetical protein Niako_1040 [Niastella koreensis GR20-10]OQP45498.1 hypothetical protein A4D02_33095 [Niastella koreensis]